jgi:hypothetical protein
MNTLLLFLSSILLGLLIHLLSNPEIPWILFFVGIFLASYAYATFLDKKQNYINYIKLKQKYKDNKEVFISDYEPFLTYTAPIRYNISGESKHLSGGYWKVSRLSLIRYNPLKEYPQLDKQRIYLTYIEANK